MKPTTSNIDPTTLWDGYVADAVARLATASGWPTQIEPGRVDGKISLLADGRNMTFPGVGEMGLLGGGPTVIASPAAIALRAFATACSVKGGNATFIAPVGRYASPVERGLIDAVVLADPPVTIEDGWIIDMMTIGHSRCWLVGVGCEWDDRARAHAMMQMREAGLRILPHWAQVDDTASLAEAMLDEGWPHGLFPDPVLMRFDVSGNGRRAKAWIAVTEGATIVSVVSAIGARLQPDMRTKDRVARVVAAWRSMGGHP